MKKPMPGRTTAAVREAVIREALRTLPRQTPGWRRLSIKEQVKLVKQYVDEHFTTQE